jgi:hypothetical protein
VNRNILQQEIRQIVEFFSGKMLSRSYALKTAPFEMYQIATDKISAMNKILINGIQSQRLSALLSSASVKHNDSPSDNGTG